MVQPGERPPKLSVKWVPVVVAVFLDAVALVTIFVHPSYSHNLAWKFVAGAAITATVATALTFALIWADVRAEAIEAQARQRVRQAEDKLSDQLRTNFTMLVGRDIVVPGVDATAEIRDEDPAALHNLPRAAAVAEQLAIERKEDRLTLAALWDVTHGRMDLYHQIVTGQARRSFGAAQVAMVIGFVLLVVFAVLAAEAKTTAAAIGAGGLGAVGAAFAAYIGKTFIRSQESAASHLRAYFDQPLELSRYLAAERLLADAKDLTAEQRAAIVSSLVQSIATAGQQNGSATDGKPTGRQPRDRARG